jgi:hypothetical protein
MGHFTMMDQGMTGQKDAKIRQAENDPRTVVLFTLPFAYKRPPRRRYAINSPSRNGRLAPTVSKSAQAI